MFLTYPKHRSPGRFPEGKVWFPGRVPGRVFSRIYCFLDNDWRTFLEEEEEGEEEEQEMERGEGKMRRRSRRSRSRRRGGGA